MALAPKPHKDIRIRIKQRIDTATNYETNNPVLLKGEMVFVKTSEGDTRTKVGDGSSTYNDLPFIDERFPKVSVSDDNKFLRVRNGKWVAETVPFSVVYTGEIEPVDDLGNDGDLYMQVDSI